MTIVAGTAAHSTHAGGPGQFFFGIQHKRSGTYSRHANPAAGRENNLEILSGRNFLLGGRSVTAGKYNTCDYLGEIRNGRSHWIHDRITGESFVRASGGGADRLRHRQVSSQARIRNDDRADERRLPYLEKHGSLLKGERLITAHIHLEDFCTNRRNLAVDCTLVTRCADEIAPPRLGSMPREWFPSITPGRFARAILRILRSVVLPRALGTMGLEAGGFVAECDAR
jgi:hypothetical protein